MSSITPDPAQARPGRAAAEAIGSVVVIDGFAARQHLYGDAMP